MTELRKQMFPQLLGYLPAFLLPLLSLLLYLPALRHGFILDDRWLVVENPYIKSWQYLPQMLTQDAWNIWDRHNYWRPVFTISLALDYSLWGLDAAGFHLTNILLHVINTVLLYSLANRLRTKRVWYLPPFFLLSIRFKLTPSTLFPSEGTSWQPVLRCSHSRLFLPERRSFLPSRCYSPFYLKRHPWFCR